MEGKDLLHKGTVIMTGFGCCRWRGIVTLFGAQLLELLECRFFCLSEMTDMTFEPRFSFGSFRRRRAHRASVFVASDHIGCLLLMIWNNLDGAFEEVAVFVYCEECGVTEEADELPPGQVE